MDNNPRKTTDGSVNQDIILLLKYLKELFLKLHKNQNQKYSMKSVSSTLSELSEAAAPRQPDPGPVPPRPPSDFKSFIHYTYPLT